MSLPLSRDQLVVLALYEPKDPKAKGTVDLIAEDRESAARARALPTMVLRHGVMLTLEYLDAKAKDETPNLATLLRKGLQAALPMLAKDANAWLDTHALASMSSLQYIAVQDAAVVVATWIKRLVDARAPEMKEQT